MRDEFSSPGRNGQSLSAAKISLLCRALGEFSPHSGRLASAGAPAHQAQVRPKRFEVADPAEAKTRLVMGDHRGERLEEVVVVVPGVFKNNRARLLRAWRFLDLCVKVLDICCPPGQPADFPFEGIRPFRGCFRDSSGPASITTTDSPANSSPSALTATMPSPSTMVTGCPRRRDSSSSAFLMNSEAIPGELERSDEIRVLIEITSSLCFRSQPTLKDLRYFSSPPGSCSGPTLVLARRRQGSVRGASPGR